MVVTPGAREEAETLSQAEVLAEVYLALVRIVAGETDPRITKEEMAALALISCRRIEMLKLNLIGLLATPILREQERRAVKKALEKASQ